VINLLVILLCGLRFISPIIDGLNITTSDVQLICDGNSLTSGSHSTAGNDYPSVLFGNYPSSWRTGNYGVSGQTLDDMVTNSYLLPVKLGALKGVLICWGGHNDFAAGVSVDSILQLTATYCAARQAEGWTVIVVTQLPSTYAGQPVGLEAMRTAYNDSLRANYPLWADAIIEIDQDSRIGDAGDQDDTNYYYTDKIHLIDAGYAIVADSAQAEVDSLIGVTR